MGRRSEAKRILKKLGVDPPPPAAAAYAALDDKDEAFRLLFNTVEAHDDWFPVFIKSNPHLAGLHSDPRWQELLRRMNLPSD